MEEEITAVGPESMTELELAERDMNRRIRFRDGLRSLINECCLENRSDTPDHILADYLIGCLANYEHTVESRRQWQGAPVWHPGLYPNRERDVMSEDDILNDLLSGSPGPSLGE